MSYKIGVSFTLGVDAAHAPSGGQLTPVDVPFITIPDPSTLSAVQLANLILHALQGLMFELDVSFRQRQATLGQSFIDIPGWGTSIAHVVP